MAEKTVKKTFTDEELKRAASILGKAGASLGGKERARKLSKKRRVEIAKIGNAARLASFDKKKVKEGT